MKEKKLSLKNTFKSISHPTANDALASGLMILGISFAVAMIIALFDYGVTALVRLIIH